MVVKSHTRGNLIGCKAIKQLKGNLVINEAAVHRSQLFICIKRYLCYAILLKISLTSSRHLHYPGELRKAELSFSLEVTTV